MKRIRTPFGFGKGYLVVALIYLLIYTPVVFLGLIVAADQLGIFSFHLVLIMNASILLPLLCLVNLYFSMNKLNARLGKALFGQTRISCVVITALCATLLMISALDNSVYDGVFYIHVFSVRLGMSLELFLMFIGFPLICTLLAWLFYKRNTPKSNAAATEEQTQTEDRMQTEKSWRPLLLYDNILIFVHLISFIVGVLSSVPGITLYYIALVLTLLAILRLIYGIFLPKILTKRTEKTQIAE